MRCAGRRPARKRTAGAPPFPFPTSRRRHSRGGGSRAAPDEHGLAWVSFFGAGVGSEVYGAVRCGRFGIGVELKESYYRQALRNMAALDEGEGVPEPTLLDAVGR